MPDYAVTHTDVTNGFATSTSQTEIDMLISVVNSADACMERHSVSGDQGKIMKIYAVRSLLSVSENGGRGQAVAERSASGASRSFREGGEGEITNFAKMLNTLDVHGCFSQIVGRQTGLGFRSVGPRD